MDRIKAAFKTPSTGLKMLEMILLIPGMILFFVGTFQIGIESYIGGTLMSAFLHAAICFLCYARGQTFDGTLLEFITSAYLVVALFIASIFLFVGLNPLKIAAGVFCLLLVFAYIAEIIYFMKKNGNPLTLWRAGT